MTSEPKYRIEFSKKAEKEFSTFDKSIQQFIYQKLVELEKSENPLRNAAKLVNFDNLYRHRFGDYRIIFSVEKDGKISILLILKVAHRKQAYQF